MFVKI